jgi:hypothetical protein
VLVYKRRLSCSLVIVPAAPSEDKEQEVPAFMYSYLSDAANTDTIPMANDRFDIVMYVRILVSMLKNIYIYLLLYFVDSLYTILRKCSPEEQPIHLLGCIYYRSIFTGPNTCAIAFLVPIEMSLPTKIRRFKD